MGFSRIYKIEKSLARLIKKNERRLQLLKLREKAGTSIPTLWKYEGL